MCLSEHSTGRSVDKVAHSQISGGNMKSFTPHRQPGERCVVSEYQAASMNAKRKSNYNFKIVSYLMLHPSITYLPNFQMTVRNNCQHLQISRTSGS